MKRQLKRETPKNYSFLDLVAPSYNRVKIIPKFAEGGDPPVNMTEPTMFMPPQALSSNQPALLNNTNEFNWNKQEYIDPGNEAWNEYKKLRPGLQDGSKEHEYFLCNLNPYICGIGGNPQFLNLRISENPEIQQLIKELDPLFDTPDKKYSYTLEKALNSKSREHYNKEIGNHIAGSLKRLKKVDITEEQKQKLQRLYDLALKNSGNEIVKNPNPTSIYDEYLIKWKSPSQWNYQTHWNYKNKADKFYNDQEAFTKGMDAWNNRSVNTESLPQAIGAPVQNTSTTINNSVPEMGVNYNSPTMFMPPETLNSGQPALLNSVNAFDWAKQEVIDPGGVEWAKEKSLNPNLKDGSREHQYFLCKMNPKMCGKETPFSLAINSSTDSEIKQLKDKLATYYTPEELQKVLTYGQYIAPGSPSAPVNLNTIIRGKSNVPADVQEAYSKLLEKGAQLSGLETTTDEQGNSVFKFVSPTERNVARNRQIFEEQQNLDQQRFNNWNNRVINNEPVPTTINSTVDNTQPTTKGPITLPKVQFPNIQSSNLGSSNNTRNTSLRDFNPFATPQITTQTSNIVNRSGTVFPTLTSNVTSSLDQPLYTDIDWMTNMFGQEAERGGFDASTGKSYGLSNFGYNTPLGYKVDNNQNSPTYGKIISKKDGSLYHNTGVFDDAPKDINEAIARYSKEYLPLVSNLPLGLRERSGHFLYNTSRDPRVYMLKSYLDSKGTPWTDEQRRSLNKDIFSNDWTPEIQQFFNEQWDANKAAIEALPIDQQVDLLDQGRDFYYQNINKGRGESNENLRAYNATHKAMIKDWYNNLPYYQQPSIAKKNTVQPSSLINPSDGITSSFISPLNPNYKPPVTSGFSMTNPYNPNKDSPLNPNYKAPVTSGFSITNPYDPDKERRLDWFNKLREENAKSGELGISQEEIDRITAGEEQAQKDMSNYGYTGSTLRLNDPIQNNGIANLPKQNQWDNLIEPLPVKRPSEYTNAEQAIIGSIKTDFKPADKDDSTGSYKPYDFNPFTTGLNILNAGLNTIGGMRNMSRMRNQENLNSFITQQPEAIYPNKRMLYGDKSMFAEMGGEYSEEGMYPDGESVYDPDAYVGELVQYKKGGIYIKPENKGKFTAWAQSHGMSVQEAAAHVMANKEKYSSTTVKRANFAKNASKWKHEDGGMVKYGDGGYVVTRSNDRKGKTHKVTGPDGTVKYFGDSSMGQHPKDPERKAAFYARHKHNLDNNPYFRAFARKTWEEGGEIDNDKEMVEGVADILSRVKDVDNRKELARYMTNQFDDENVDYDYDQFLAATNLMEMAYGGMYPDGGPILRPIFTSDRNDSRLRNYNDSLSLYRAYEFQRNNFRPGYEAWLTDVSRDYPGGREALRRDRERNIGKPGTIIKNKKPKSGFKDKNIKYDTLRREEKPIVDYYKSLVGNDPNFRIGVHASPDLWHRDINPIALYFDGSMSPVYKEPVQPVIYQEEVVKEEPLKKETITTKTTTTPIQNLPVKWFALGTGADGNYDNILIDNKYLTRDEFEKFKIANPNFRYAQKPDSIGRKYSYGGHYIPQDVNYIGGKFVPNLVDLQEFAEGGWIKKAVNPEHKGYCTPMTKSTCTPKRKALAKTFKKHHGFHEEGGEYGTGGEMIKRADGSYSQRGLWDNIRANKGSGKKPTKEMLKQERKIKKGYKAGGEYMEGNEYEISGTELERLRSLGYDVELI